MDHLQLSILSKGMVSSMYTFLIRSLLWELDWRAEGGVMINIVYWIYSCYYVKCYQNGIHHEKDYC